MTVHPHGCGENLPEYLPGTRERRFTPTGVGKTMATCSKSAVVDGSPPRVWGKLRAPQNQVICRRFTPTGVGKTYSTLPVT